MTDWYVSSAAYATYAVFAGSTLYNVGDIIVPTVPANAAKWVFRCTTQGTSTTEPTWATTNNATSTSGTAVFTNVTGQSTYFWTAAAGDLLSLMSGSRVAAGDRTFLSSDHTETQPASAGYGSTLTQSFLLTEYLCVNRAGSTPPVAADLRTGATLIASLPTINNLVDTYWYGVIFSATGATLQLGSSTLTATKTLYLKNCQLSLVNAPTSASIGPFASGEPNVPIFLDNTAIRIAGVGHKIAYGGSCGSDLHWFNSTFSGTTSFLFNSAQAVASQAIVTVRGVDLSTLTGTLVNNAGPSGSKYLFESCKIASAVGRYSGPGTNTRDVVELINCYDGTNYISERHGPNGDVTTEFSITLSGGATDNVGLFSHKMVSTASIDKIVYPLCGFWLDCGYVTTGSAKTATVEIIASTTLNNDQIALYLEYQGTAGSSITSFADSFIVTPLTSAVPVPTSSATWNASPATPVMQKLQVTFTPQMAGRVRGQVRLGSPNTTVYYNPQITIS